MTKDWDQGNSIKLGKDLQCGDCISGGVVYRVNGLSRFYEGKPHYEVYDINDPQDGPYSSNLDLEEEFTVINSRKEILRYYNIVELGLLSHAADIMDYRRDFMVVKQIAIDALNRKLNAEKAKE